MTCKNRVNQQLRTIIEEEVHKVNGEFGISITPDMMEALILQEGGKTGVANKDISDKGATQIAYGITQISYARAITPKNGILPADPVSLGPLVPHGDASSTIRYGELVDVKKLAGDPSLPNGEGDRVNVSAATRAFAHSFRQCGKNNPSCLYAGYNANEPRYNKQGYYINQNRVDSFTGHYNCITNGDAGLPAKVGAPRPLAPASGGGSIHNETGCPSEFKFDERIIIPHPILPNPNHPTFFLTVGGFLDSNGKIAGGTTLTPARPEYIHYLEYNDTIGAGDSFIVRFFDPSIDAIQSQILVGIAEQFKDKEFVGTQNVLLEWGYTEPGVHPKTGEPIYLTSGVHALRLLGLSITFFGYGAEITLQGMGDFGVARMVGDLQETHPNLKTKEIIDAVNRTSGGPYRISDIVRFLMKKNGWVPCITPTEVLAQDRTFKQVGDDITFIQQLIPDTRSQDGHGDYYFNYDAKTKIAHFHPLTISDVIRRYSYAQHQQGAVLGFQAQINGEALVVVGGVSVTHSSVDFITKEKTSSLITDGVDRDPKSSTRTIPNPITTMASTGLIVPSDKVDQFRGPVGRVSGKVMLTSVESAKERISYLSNIYDSARKMAIEATLYITGDPLIKPPWNILVIIPGKDGSPHFVSGKYWVHEVQHVIESGRYTTTLSLFRSDLGAITDYSDPIQASITHTVSQNFGPGGFNTLRSGNNKTTDIPLGS